MSAREVITMSYDLAEEKNCEEAVEETVKHFKCLDVLVNCAGILVVGPVDTFSTADYDKVRLSVSYQINPNNIFLTR